MHPIGVHATSNKPILADSPTDSLKSGLCKTSSLDNGLDLLIGADSVSIASSVGSSDTTTPSSPPSVIYCVGSHRRVACGTPADGGNRELLQLASLHGKPRQGYYSEFTYKSG